MLRHWLRLFGLLLMLCANARGHDPFEAFHSAILRADRLDLTVTMAKATALRLIDPEARIRELTPETLAEHRARLASAGAALLTLTSKGKPLAAKKTEIELTEENDVIFRMTYPRPASGVLRFAAVYLKKLGDGYGGILEVNDAADRNLGWEQLLWSHPDFEVKIPATPTP